MPWWAWLVIAVGSLGILGWAGLIYLMVQFAKFKSF